MSPLDLGRWREIRELFDELVDLAAAPRNDRLAAIAAADPELGAAVGALLDADAVAGQRLERLDFGVSAVLQHASAPEHRPFDAMPAQGTTIAHFRVLEPIGSGGMGAVYRAIDTRLQRVVALKLPLHPVEDAAVKERFLREARLAGGLDHPNLCPVYDAGETSAGQLYIAMPCYAGRTLKQLLAREGPLPLAQALDIALQAAEGLAFAHAAHVIHRDLKPGNLMVLADGTVKILDFGLAKTPDLSHTASGRMLGTAAYMAPEQLRGGEIDPRVDLWALGVVLYEMLTGVRPFTGENELAVAHAIVSDDPIPPATLREDLPRAIDHLVLNLLQRETAQRYPDARRLAADITAIREGGVPALRYRRSSRATQWLRGRSRRTRIAMVAAAVLVLSSTGLAARQLFSRETPPGGAAAASAFFQPGADHSIAVLPFVNLGAEGDPDYFSDGLSEQIIHVLGGIPGLRVAARTSSFALRDAKLDIRTIGDTLNVSAVLEGSVRRERDRLRVTAQLVDASSGYPVWSGEYDRATDEVVTVQDEIARDIARALELRLPADRPDSRLTPDPQAYDLYLRALYLRDTYTPDALRQARAYLDRAVELDPDFARAYALKVTVLGPAIFWRYIPLEPALSEIRAASARAVELDPGLGEAYAAQGAIKLFFDRDFPAAERALRRAVELNPNDNFAWHVLANYYSILGRPAEEAAARAQGSAVDPLNPRYGFTLAMAYVAAGRLPEALAQFERMLKLNALDPLALGLGPSLPAGPARVYLKQGRYREAVEDHVRVANLRGASTPEVDSLRAAFERGGMPAFWRSWLAFDLRHSGGDEDPVRVATIYALAGDTAQTLAWLERASAEQSPALLFAFADPAFAPLREHPRFRRIFRELRLPGS